MIDSAGPGRGRRTALAAALLTTLCLLALPSSAAASTLGLTASDATIGGTIQATAQLSDAADAAGSISFKVFGPGDPDCQGPALAEPSATAVSGEGSYPSGTFTPTVVGTYHWSAHFSGDLANAEADAECAALSTVSKATPLLAGSASSGVVGNPIRDEATLSGAHLPSGTVTFAVFAPGDLDCTTPLATGAAPLAGDKATASDFVPTEVGEFRWTASYPGDDNNAAASTLCNAAGQSSTVSKATPLLVGTATSAPRVGLTITDSVVVSSSFQASGKLVFRAFGPGDPACAQPVAEQELDLVGDGTYVSNPFKPAAAGLYLWTVTYAGDANNLGASTSCGAANQGSAVGTLDVTLVAGAVNSTVGGSLTATATLGNGAIPGGQLTFRAFAPGDTACSGAAAFTSTAAVKGNGSYSSAAFTPGQVGSYRWTVAYSGDVNHAAAATACGAAASTVAKANPTIAGRVGKKLTVGTRFRDTATLAGGFSPGGTITFEIYLPGNRRCDRPNFVNTVTVNGNGSFRSDPFVAKRAGRYRFVARYSGDASNQAATEACSSPEQLAQVRKRTPRLRPRAQLIAAQQISIRANLAGASSPTGVISFRLFAPDDLRCSGRPAFTGSLRVRKNGTFTLAEYIATEPGTYRLGIAYSGDPRNAKTRITCAGTQSITVRG